MQFPPILYGISNYVQTSSHRDPEKEIRIQEQTKTAKKVVLDTHRNRNTSYTDATKTEKWGWLAKVHAQMPRISIDYERRMYVLPTQKLYTHSTIKYINKHEKP